MSAWTDAVLKIRNDNEARTKKNTDVLQQSQKIGENFLGSMGGVPSVPLTPEVFTPPDPVKAEPIRDYSVGDVAQEFYHGVRRFPGQSVALGAEMANVAFSSPALADITEGIREQGYKDYPALVQAPSTVEELGEMSIADLAMYAIGEAPQFLSSMLPIAGGSKIAMTIMPKLVKGASTIPRIAKAIKKFGGLNKVAQTISGMASSVAMETGSSHSAGLRARTEDPSLPEVSRLTSFKWGLPKGLLESFEQLKAVGTISPKLYGKATKSLKQMAIGYGKDIALDGAIETGTEALQNILDDMGAENLAGTPTFEAIKKVASDPNTYVKAGAAGLAGFGGGVMSGSSSSLRDAVKRAKQKAIGDFAEAPTADKVPEKITPEALPTTPKDTPSDMVPDAVSTIPAQPEFDTEVVNSLLESSGIVGNDVPVLLQQIYGVNDVSELGQEEVAQLENLLMEKLSEGTTVSGDVLGKEEYSGLLNAIAQSRQDARQANYVPETGLVTTEPTIPTVPTEVLSEKETTGLADAIRRAREKARPPLETPNTIELGGMLQLENGVREARKKAELATPESIELAGPTNLAEAIQAVKSEPQEATNKDLEHLFGMEEGQIEKDEGYKKQFAENIKTEKGLNSIGDEDHKLLEFSEGFGKNKGKDYHNKEYTATDEDGAERNYILKIVKDQKTGKTISSKLDKGDKTDNQKENDKITNWESLPEDLRTFLDKAVPERRKDLATMKDVADQILGNKFRSGLGISELFDSGGQEVEDLFGKEIAEELKTGSFNQPKMLDALIAKYENKQLDNPVVSDTTSSSIYTLEKKAGVNTIYKPDGEIFGTYNEDLSAKVRLAQLNAKEGLKVEKNESSKYNKEDGRGLDKARLQEPKADEQKGQVFSKENERPVRPVQSERNEIILNTKEGLKVETNESIPSEATTKVENAQDVEKPTSNELPRPDGNSSNPEGSSSSENGNLVAGQRTGRDILNGNEKGMEETSSLLAQDVGKAGDVNVINLAKALVPTMEKLLTADKPMDNRQLKKVMKELGIDPTDKNYNHKITQEAVEAAMVEVVRKNNLQGDPDALIKLYNNQPNLAVRTGTSIANQAYSTPIPLVGMVTDAIGGIEDGAVVYEPTAGNGLLLTGIKENADGTKMDYRLNELDKTRNDLLKHLFPDAIVTNQDALNFVPEGEADLIFTNPPFGSLKSFGEEAFTIKAEGEISPTIKFKKIDHAIVAKALQSMKDNGRAVIVVGADLIQGEPNKSVIKNKVLYNYLYNQFNVTGHFEVSGKLYNRQGANWPVAIITLEGRKSFPKNYVSAPNSVERAVSWNDVKEITSKIKSGNYLTGKPRLTSSEGQATNTTDNNNGSEQTINESDQSGNISEPKSELDTGPATTDVGRSPEGQSIPDSTSDTGEARNGIRNEFKPIREETYKERERAGETSKPVTSRLGPDDNRGVTGEDSSLQAKYKPVSNIGAIGSLVPVNLENPIRESLEGLEKEVGQDLEDYVAIKLGYKSSKDLIDKKSGRSILSAEQIDAVALAINAIDRNGGVIVADQTGLGKGRVAAASIAYAVKAGKTPVFITEKAGLFNDIYRDLKNIAESGLRPFIFNGDGAMSDPNTGKVIYKHSPSKFKTTFDKMQKGDYSDFGEGGQYDFIVTSYSQFNKKSAPKLMALLRAPSKSLVAIMDESHNAAGVTEGTQSNQGENISALLSEDITSGVVYLSATWAKRPEQMVVYHRAFGKGQSTIDEINEAFTRGGLAMQEMMVTSMARTRSYIRREQSFEGVSFQREKTEDGTPASKRENELAEKTMELVMNITDLGKVANVHMGDIDISDLDIPDDFVGGDLDSKGNSVTASIDQPTSPFSQIHNYVSAFVTALKAKDTAKKVIDAIKAGQKPVIVVKNTMEAQLNSLIDLGKASVGSSFTGTFTDVLDLIQDKILTIQVKSSFDSDKKMTIKIPLDKFPAQFQTRFNALKDKINATDLGDMPFSPIDYLKGEVSKAGLNIGELTGRSKFLDYSNMKNGNPTLSVRNTSEYNQEGRRKVVYDFNNGDVDALILNQAGSTGLSAHSSFEYKDQRQRVMFILQAFDDINTFMQMIGRIHRVGAVTKSGDVSNVIPSKPSTYGHPEYKYLQSSLCMEIRTGIQLENKMKSLNAQTSSNEKGHQSVADVDVMNKYGLQAMENWLDARRKVAASLELEDNLSVERITGRIALLSQQLLQNEFWEDVVNEYTEIIDQLDAAGENDLVVPTMKDANAKTLSKQVVYGEEGNLDTPPVYLERLELTLTGKPVSLEGARQRAEKGTNITPEELKERNEQFEVFKKAIIEKHPKMNMTRLEMLKDQYERRIKKLKLGQVVSSSKGQMGVITKVSFKPASKSFISNPFNPSSVKIEMASNNKTGSIVISLSGFVREGYTISGDIDALSYVYKSAYEKEYNNNLTRQITTNVLTGDMIKAQSMNKESIAAQFGREDGTQDFGWIPKNYRTATSETSLDLVSPVEVLTNKSIDKDTPNGATSIDGKSVVIRPATKPQRDWGSGTAKLIDVEIEGDPATKPFEIVVLSAKSAKFGRKIYSDPSLMDLIKTGEQHAVFTETKLDGKKALKASNIPISKKASAMKIINDILKSAASGLVNAKKKKIKLNDLSKDSSKKGSSALLDTFNEYVADGIYNVLNSAFKHTGSFVSWLQTAIKKFGSSIRSKAAKIWADARKFVKFAGPNSRRGGGSVSLKDFMRSIEKKVAEQPVELKEAKLKNPKVQEFVATEQKEAFEAGRKHGETYTKKVYRKHLEKRGDKIQKAREHLKAVKAQFKAKREFGHDARMELVTLASKLPPKVRARYIKGIAKTNTAVAFGNMINTLDRAFAKWEHRDAMQKYLKVLKNNDVKKLYPEFRDAIDELTDDIYNTKVAIQMVQGIMKYVEDDNQDYIDPYTKGVIDALSKGDNNNVILDAETINTITTAVKALLEADRRKKMLIQGKKLVDAVETGAEIQTAIGKTKKIADEFGKTGFIGKYFDVALLSLENIADMFGKAGKKLFFDDLQAAEIKTLDIWYEGRDALAHKLKEVGLDAESKELQEWANEEVDVQIANGETIKVPRSVRMNLLANLSDESTYGELLEGGIKLDRLSETIMLDEAALENLSERATAKEVTLVKVMKNFINGRLKDAFNATNVDLISFEKAFSLTYWPRKRETEPKGFSAGYQQWASSALEHMGITKQRTGSKKAVIIGDVFSTYQTHIKQASTFIGTAIPLRNVEMALGVGGVGLAIEKHMGKAMFNRIKAQMEAIGDLGNMAQGDANEAVGTWLQRAAVGFLGYNVRSSIKQAGGLAAAATEISLTLIAQNLGKAIDPVITKRIFKYSSQLRNRYDGAGAKIVRPTFNDRDTIIRADWKDRQTKKAMAMLEAGDRAVTQVIWGAVESELANEKGKMSMDEFYKKVARRTEIIVMRTQNVTSKLGMSGTAIESRKNAFLKTMVAFQSQGNAIYNIVRRAMRRYRNGDIDLPEFAGILAMALLGNAMWSVLVSHFVTLKILTGKKPPITSKSMASELLRENIGNLYGGSMINPFVRVVTQAWQGKNVFGGAHMENVAESVFNDVAMGAAQVLTSPMKEGNDKKIKALKKSSLKFLNGLLPAAGVPVMPFKEGINLLSLLDKD